MQSLRTRKPTEPGPRGQKKLARPGPRDALARKSTRVDDKIKKRMSMRYADISLPTDALVPDVPSIPIGLRPGGYRPQEETIRERERPKDTREADLKLLDKDEFDPDVFLKSKLANSTEAELKSLQSSLRSLKDGVATDLQRNVFKNYAEFVVVSKEVSTLENEMLEFKDSLAEWKGMPSVLHIDDSASVAERRRNVRSSIADLRVLYANQMQNLHTQIEGSAKFVPTTPGRHVIAEIDGIFALNPATYKVAYSVRYVLLDDAILVAKRRRRRNNMESEKLIAERCWPLNEMLVLDTKDSASLTNVFKIRHNKETHVYRTEIGADKKSLLSQFRHLAEEHSAKRQKEREGEHQRRKSLWVGDRQSIAISSDVPPMPDFLAEFAGDPEMGSTAKDDRDTRWVGEFTDELTVAVALRQWEQAVNLVEEGEGKLTTIPTLAAKLTPLKASLIAALLQSLSLSTNRKTIVVQLTGFLSRLGASAAARNTYLTARADMLRKCIRTIPFEGHIGMYVGDLATVVFTGIKHSADWFLASFKENEVASGFVEWAKDQIENFAEMFRKQVYGPDVDSETIEDAIKIVHLQSKKLLEDFGLDFRYLLNELLREKPKSTKLPPPNFRPHHDRPPEPIFTPSPTPVRSRSPAPSIAAPIPRRSSPPPIVPPLPLGSLLTSSTPELPLGVPSPIRSPLPRPPQSSSGLLTPRAGTPTLGGVSGQKSARASPAPPPRSRDRPGSGVGVGPRPPPVAIPRRDGMF